MALLIGMLCLVWGAPAAADTVKTPWQFRFVPYAWLAGIDGGLRAKGQTIDVDMSFADIWDDLDFGGMLYLEANNDRWGVYANTVHAKLSPDKMFPAGRVDVEVESWIFDFGLLFRLMGYGEEGETLDCFLGGRYWDQQNQLDVNFEEAGIVGTIEDSSNWIDPVIGLRYISRFSKHFGFSARGDIGGFDISGSTSDWTWSVQGILEYRFGEVYSLCGGYRALGVDYKEGSPADRFRLDATLQGPVIGIGFEF